LGRKNAEAAAGYHREENSPEYEMKEGRRCRAVKSEQSTRKRMTVKEVEPEPVAKLVEPDQ